MKRIMIALLALAAWATSSAAGSALHAGTGYTSLGPPGVGPTVSVCAICNTHGLADVVPSVRTGWITSVTLNLGAHGGTTPDASAVVEVHRPAAGSAVVGALVTTVSVPVTQLRSNAYERFALSRWVYVRRGTPVVLVLRLADPTPDNGAWEVRTAAARGTYLYGYHAGVWNSMGRSQVQVATGGRWL